MSQPPRRSSRLRNDQVAEGAYGSSGRRRVSLNPAIDRIMADNRESLCRELWDLNRESDMGAGRSVSHGDDEDVPAPILKSILNNSRYTIVYLTLTNTDVADAGPLPNSLRTLYVAWHAYGRLPPLPNNLVSLIVDTDDLDNRTLVLPPTLQALESYGGWDEPIVLPASLTYLDLGSRYRHPLGPLPSGLKVLKLSSLGVYNHPITLPSTILTVELPDAYDKPIVFPSGIKVVRIGADFPHTVAFPESLEKLRWDCNRLVQIPETLLELELGSNFNQPIAFPAGLKFIQFPGTQVVYSHPITFPPALEKLSWYREYAGLILPQGLRKLTWGSVSVVELPSNLKEFVLQSNIQLTLPEGLVKFDFSLYLPPGTSCHMDLPGSVEHVIWRPGCTFTHPSTLQHLTVGNGGDIDIDLSHYKIDKITIDSGMSRLEITRLPPKLKELEFTADSRDSKYGGVTGTIPVPRGCKVKGGEGLLLALDA